MKLRSGWQNRKRVTIVEALDRLMAINGPLCHANKDMLGRLIPYRGVKTVTSPVLPDTVTNSESCLR